MATTPTSSSTTTTTTTTTSTGSPPPTPHAYLVETLPVGNFSLDLVPGEGLTWEAQLDLVNQSKKTLDITVMYWNLNAANNATKNGASARNFTPAEFVAFGADRGRQRR